jgi:pimeloyl-ACP methyl ester carboxylesterase
MRFALPVAALALLSLASCKSKDAPQAAPKAPSAAPSASAAPEVPKDPPSVSEEVTFPAKDGAPLAGTLYLAKDPAAPLLVFVHRYRGDRKEWTKVLGTLASSPKRFTMLAFDLRGHGDSKTGTGKKRLDWGDMKPKDVPPLVDDVHAAIDYAASRTTGKANRVVLVGSSLGAALAARAASQDARVVAIAMVAPGAAIEGFDVYHPFADVRMLPSFLVSANQDNVAKEPIDGLTRMAKEHATVRSYEGRGHGAFGLLSEGDPLDVDLEQWLMGVFDSAPVERELSPKTGEKASHASKKGQPQ